MSETDISLLESQFIQNMERARQDRAQNGNYTKKGLLYLVNAATCQYSMSKITEGVTSQRHKETATEILKEACEQAKNLGIILPTTPTPAKKAVINDQTPVAPTPTVPTTPQTSEQKPVTEQEDGTDPEAELEELVGLTEVKKELAGIINILAANEIRKERDMPVIPKSMHMVFTGHAGTGKTTVGRLVGRILKKHGVLSKGHLVEINGLELVKGYVGQSGEAMQKAGTEAIGGILFIDEAYGITESKFASEVVPLLLSIMENNRDDLCVIAAGYVDKMKSFVDYNEGMQSRFANFVHFPDYSSDEMLIIFERMCKSKKQSITPEAAEYLKKIFEERREDPRFGNARGVRNIFEFANEALANRIAIMSKNNETIPDETLSTLTLADIRKAAEKRTGV